MQTIVLATQKGGSGKSTLAIGLALAAKQAGHNVRLLETDQQGTLSNWQSRRGLAEPIVEAIQNAGDIAHRLESLERGGVTLTIIDTAGGISAIAMDRDQRLLGLGSLIISGTSGTRRWSARSE